MPSSVAVVIRANPTKTHRAVEALRIALGLSAGEHSVTVFLLGQAPLLLTQDLDHVIDADILEKYLPSLQQLSVPFVMAAGTGSSFRMTPGFHVHEEQAGTIAKRIASSDRALVFS
ncbi:MAG: DsrE family protein [Nitrospirota bacterium]